MNEIDELLLIHFGTKGMKWGVRKKIIGSKVFQATERHAQKTATSRRAMAGQKVGKVIYNHRTAAKRIAAGALFATAAIGGYVAGKSIGKRGLLYRNIRYSKIAERGRRAAWDFIHEDFAS